MSNRVPEILRKSIAQADQRPLDNTLFYGPQYISAHSLSLEAQSIGVTVRIVLGSNIERGGDLAAILTHLREGDILFIDGIHRLNKSVGSMLQPAMRIFVLDLVVGKGATAKTIRPSLPRFTVVGTAPKAEALPSDLLHCFSLQYNLTSTDD